ncbi:hypothetical protein F4561_005206 [Lipingzhangella halophila]|uniref:DDE superfamily endonuclease n=1 Tax=Lipingzhangella halophila TaxID=1783352 RepID=A0A7W7RLW8_9ACTN|nr:hypothetical protein [Lipingzhangella halophila]
MLVHLRKGETFAELAAAFAVGTATAWRYVRETTGLLARRTRSLEAALRRVRRAGWAFVVLDGTLIPIDRVAADRPFYSGKHKRHVMNVQVVAAPDGAPLWVSGSLPGAVHDLTAAGISGALGHIEASGLVTMADEGYLGAGHGVVTPFKGRDKPEWQKQINSEHARRRVPGERANAELKKWRILRKLRCCPMRAGQIVRAVLVLHERETG